MRIHHSPTGDDAIIGIEFESSVSISAADPALSVVRPVAPVPASLIVRDEV